jgi:queuine tRNA-ribosyltransferase
MPVGTVASVKGVHQRELREEINPDIILGNTYHLYFRPQTEILEKAGQPWFQRWFPDVCAAMRSLR